MDSPSTLMWLIQKKKFLILIITPLPLPPSPLEKTFENVFPPPVWKNRSPDTLTKLTQKRNFYPKISYIYPRKPSFNNFPHLPERNDILNTEKGLIHTWKNNQFSTHPKKKKKSKITRKNSFVNKNFFLFVWEIASFQTCFKCGFAIFYFSKT